MHSTMLDYLRESPRNPKNEIQERFNSSPIVIGLIQSHPEGAQGLQEHTFPQWGSGNQKMQSNLEEKERGSPWLGISLQQ